MKQNFHFQILQELRIILENSEISFDGRSQSVSILENIKNIFYLEI